MDCSLPGSSVHGIFQARVLEWGAIAFSEQASRYQKQTYGSVRFSSVQSLSCVRLFATPWTAAHQAPLSMGFSRQEYWSGVPSPSPFFNMVLPKINVFSFPKPWPDNGSTYQDFCQLFYGWEMTHLLSSYLKSTYCGRGTWCNSLSLEVSLLSD